MSSVTYDDWESAADAMDNLNVPAPVHTSWEDAADDYDATLLEIKREQQKKQSAPAAPTTNTKLLAKAPTKQAQERKAQEDADLRIAAEMLGGDGSVLAPAELPTGTLVDVAAFTKYGTTMCEHLHGLTTAKIPAKHLVAFYKAVIADAAKHLAPEDLLLLGQAVDGARNEKLRAAKGAKTGAKSGGGAAAKAVPKKIYVGRDDDVGMHDGMHDGGDFGDADDY